MAHYVVFRKLWGLSIKGVDSLSTYKGLNMRYQGEWFELGLEWLPTQREALKGLVNHSFIYIPLLRAYHGLSTDLDTTEDQRGVSSGTGVLLSPFFGDLMRVRVFSLLAQSQLALRWWHQRPKPHPCLLS